MLDPQFAKEVAPLITGWRLGAVETLSAESHLQPAVLEVAKAMQSSNPDAIVNQTHLLSFELQWSRAIRENSTNPRGYKFAVGVTKAALQVIDRFQVMRHYTFI